MSTPDFSTSYPEAYLSPARDITCVNQLSDSPPFNIYVYSEIYKTENRVPHFFLLSLFIKGIPAH